jgi:GntR family transcriptional regulator
MSKTNIPTSQRLVDELSVLIASVEPGSRLPSEPVLAKNLSVSRATLREAMRTFETQGLIRRRQGSGTFVVKPSYVIETGLEVLESIEKIAERIGLPVSMGELKIERCPADQEDSAALGLKPGETCLRLSRVIYAEGRAVAFLVDSVPTDILTENDIGPEFKGSVLDLLLERGTPDLMISRCEINAVTANHDMARSLGIQRGDVLLRFKAYLYDTSGRIVDHSYSYFLPGYFRFHVVRKIG